jgi:hypothetical protein
MHAEGAGNVSVSILETKQRNPLRFFRISPISPPNAGKYWHFRLRLIGPSSILPITRFQWGKYVNSDYFVLLRRFLWFYSPTSNRPERTTYAKCESATCGRSRRNGARCLSVSFPETWNAQGYTLVCFEKRNAGKNRASFLLFHYRHVSTLALAHACVRSFVLFVCPKPVSISSSNMIQEWLQLLVHFFSSEICWCLLSSVLASWLHGFKAP